MRKTLAPTLALTLVVLALAGMAWAGQTAAQVAREQAVDEGPALRPAPRTNLPSGGKDLDAKLPSKLIQDPMEMDACCFAECYSARWACNDACPPFSTPEGEACRHQCYQDWLACKSHC